ncbi:hypothetical protein [Paenibacillus ottowii]
MITHRWEGKEQDAEIIFGHLSQAGLDYIHVTEYQAWQPAFPEQEGENQEVTLAALAKKICKSSCDCQWTPGGAK